MSLSSFQILLMKFDSFTIQNLELQKFQVSTDGQNWSAKDWHLHVLEIPLLHRKQEQMLQLKYTHIRSYCWTPGTV